MVEGPLYPSTTPGCYAIGSAYGPDLTRGQAIEILLGGQWVRGQVAYSNSYPPATKEGFDPRQRDRGAYALAPEFTEEDLVTEASEESFPASDAPSWTISHHERSPSRQLAGGSGISNGYYFLADDGSVCGLCIGMHVRTR